MAKAKPRVKVPKQAAQGEIVEIKTLISHAMETGQRKDRDGNPIPRQIINKFSCTLNGKEVFSADWQPAISANPYLAFHLKATESGTLEFTWLDDDGSTYSTSADIEVG